MCPGERGYKRHAIPRGNRLGCRGGRCSHCTDEGEDLIFTQHSRSRFDGFCGLIAIILRNKRKLPAFNAARPVGFFERGNDSVPHFPAQEPAGPSNAATWPKAIALDVTPGSEIAGELRHNSPETMEDRKKARRMCWISLELSSVDHCNSRFK